MKAVNNESGQGLSEYLILVLLIAVISIGAVKSLGGTIREKIKTVRNNIHSGVVLSD